MAFINVLAAQQPEPAGEVVKVAEETVNPSEQGVLIGYHILALGKFPASERFDRHRAGGHRPGILGFHPL